MPREPILPPLCRSVDLVGPHVKVDRDGYHHGGGQQPPQVEHDCLGLRNNPKVLECVAKFMEKNKKH